MRPADESSIEHLSTPVEGMTDLDMLDSLFEPQESVGCAQVILQDGPPLETLPPPCVLEAHFESLPPPEKEKPESQKFVSVSAPHSRQSKSHSKRTAHEENYDQIDRLRVWSETHRSCFFDARFALSMKTRLSPVLEVVPKNIYGTLKYRIFVETGSMEDSSTALMARVDLVHPPSGEVEPGAFTSQLEAESAFRFAEGKFQTDLYIQVRGKALSHQKTKKEFALRVSIFRASDRSEILAQYETPSFRVYARKPNQPSKKQRAQEEGKKEVFAPRGSSSSQLSKPRKMVSSKMQHIKKQAASVDEFTRQLDSLFSLHSQFDSSLKKKSHDLILSKLLGELIGARQ